MFNEAERRGAVDLITYVNQIEPDVVRALVKTCTEDRVSPDSVETLNDQALTLEITL